jgi:hypothetical protein
MGCYNMPPFLYSRGLQKKNAFAFASRREQGGILGGHHAAWGRTITSLWPQADCGLSGWTAGATLTGGLRPRRADGGRGLDERTAASGRWQTRRAAALTIQLWPLRAAALTGGRTATSDEPMDDRATFPCALEHHGRTATTRDFCLDETVWIFGSPLSSKAKYLTCWPCLLELFFLCTVIRREANLLLHSELSLNQSTCKFYSIPTFRGFTGTSFHFPSGHYWTP